VPGLYIPPTVRAAAGDLKALAEGRRALEELLPGEAFPLLLRPMDSHGGKGLARIAGSDELAEYLNRVHSEAFFLSPFIDYRGPDGLHRKMRIAFIDGTPYACHMAVAEHWMLHYLNAGMDGDPSKREEEARHFATFDTDFAVRHAAAMKGLCERAGLEYFAIDCAETRDGGLLIFEADTAMIVHDMDPPALYPYKGPQMQRVFQAFRAMLEHHANR
jgi:glutathione synthase/RimK-type ligase-like ATP-grasp enzyme